ncbi:MAG: DUF4097 family beta strand repeat-containing protein, partial [Gemmatimonadota bacterium]
MTRPPQPVSIRHPRPIVIALLAIGLVLAAQSPAQAQGPDRRIERTVPFDADGSFRIYNMTGSVRVEAWDRDSLSITGTVPGGRGNSFFFGGTRRGAKMGIEAPTDLEQQPAHLVIRAPARAHVWIKSATANVVLVGLTGGVDVFSTSGNIKFQGEPDQLNLETMDGNIDVDARGVWIRAKTASGIITLRGTGEDIAASTVSGNISLLSGGMRRARIETVSGDIAFAGTLTRDGALTVESHSGATDILLPASMDGEFDLSTYQGTIRNDFAPGKSPIAESTGMGLHFTSGDGTANVSVKTFKGAIVLRKK